MTLQHLNPNGTPRFYTHAVVAESSKVAFISGQVAMVDREIVGKGDFIAQADKAFENFNNCLEAMGATMENVTKMTLLIVGLGPDHRPALQEIQERHLPATNPPAQTTIGVQALGHPDFLIEIEGYAVL